MPEDHRDYSMREVAVLVHDYPNTHQNERAREGDIIEIRKPIGQIGRLEAAHILWLLIEGLDTGEMAKLKERFFEGPDTEASPVYEKRRFCIPFDRLKQVVPSIDVNRIRDRADKYQPFLPVDLDWPYYRFATEGYNVHGWQYLPAGIIARPPLDVHGLVFDKKATRYL